MNNYSPQMVEKLDSNGLPLATTSILGQAPGRRTGPEQEVIPKSVTTICANERIVRVHRVPPGLIFTCPTRMYDNTPGDTGE